MKILRRPEMLERVGLSTMQQYRLEKAGEFPARVKLGTHSVGWLEHEVDQWIEACAAERGQQTAA